MKRKLLILLSCIVLIATIAIVIIAQDRDNNQEEHIKKVETTKDTNGGLNTEIPNKETDIPEETVEPSTKAPDSAETKNPTVEPTATIEPTVEPTIKPTVKPTKTAEPTIKPTVKPTEKPVETKAPTKKPVVTIKPTVKPTTKPKKTYWYEVPIDNGRALQYIESELSPDKYPVPEGYEPWRGPEYDQCEDRYYYRTKKIKIKRENVLVYNGDGSANLKDCTIYYQTEETMWFVIKSKEVTSYLNSKGVDVNDIYSIHTASAFMPVNGENIVRRFYYEVSYRNSNYSNGATTLFFDQNYNITETDPYR